MKKYKLLLLLIGTAVMIVVMAKTGATLKTPTTPKGILDLEFACNSTKTATVLNAWAPNDTIDNISAAKNNTYYDFIFLFFYSPFLFFACKKIAAITNSKIGVPIATAALCAGILDIFENAGMLLTLSNHSAANIAMLTTTISIIKWVLAIAAVIYLLAGLVQLIVQKKLHLLLA